MLWKNTAERLAKATELLPICGLPMIDAFAEEELEQEAVVESFVKTCTRYKIEVSAEKIKLQ